MFAVHLGYPEMIPHLEWDVCKVALHVRRLLGSPFWLVLGGPLLGLLVSGWKVSGLERILDDVDADWCRASLLDRWVFHISRLA